MRKGALCKLIESTVFIRLFLTGFVGIFLAAALVGVSPKEASQVSLVIAIQICTGAALWRMFKPPSKESIHELFGVGLAVGSSVAVLSHLVLFRTFIGEFSWIVPSIVLLIIVATSQSAKSRFLKIEIEKQDPLLFDALILSATVGLSFWWWWTLPVVAGLLIIKHLLANSIRSKHYGLTILGGIATIGIVLLASYLKNLNNGWWLFSYDQIFSESLSISLANWGPTDNIQLAGSNIRYHWFALAWAGITTQGAAIGSWVMVTKILPICALIGVVSLLWSISTKLSNSRFIPIATVFSFSLISNPFTFQPSKFIHSPTFYFSMVWLLAFSLFFLDGVKQKGWYKHVFLIVMYCSALAGKVSTGAVIFGAVAFSLFCITVVYRGNKMLIRYNAAVLGLLFASTVIVYLHLYRGQTISTRSGFQSASMYLDPFQIAPTFGIFNYESALTIRFIALLVVLLSFLPMLLSSFLILLRPWFEGSVAYLYLSGLTFSGLFGIVLFNHDGGSQLYFLLAAMTTVPILITYFAEFGYVKYRTNFPPQKLATITLSGATIAIFVERYWRESIFGGESQRQIGISKVTLILVAFMTTLVVAFLLSGPRRLRSDRVKRYQFFGWLVFMVLLSSSISHGVFQRVETTLDFSKKIEADRSSPDLMTGSDAHIDALVWLKNNSELNDIVSVNRFCMPGIEPCISKWLLVTALTHRRALIEGGYFDVTDPPEWAREKIKYSIEFAESPNSINHRWLVKQKVAWAVIDHSAQVSGLRNWEPFGVVAYTNEFVTIVKLNK